MRQHEAGRIRTQAVLVQNHFSGVVDGRSGESAAERDTGGSLQGRCGAGAQGSREALKD